MKMELFGYAKFSTGYVVKNTTFFFIDFLAIICENNNRYTGRRQYIGKLKS